MACASTGGSKPPRPAQPVHRLQGIRFPGRDYRIPAFYLITMTTLGRKPRFGTCADNAVTLSSDALAALHQEALDEVRAGGVLVSPFISPGEKDIARAALDAGGSVILMKPDGFEPRFKPKGHYFDLCAQGRLLILSCAPTPAPLTRDLCLAMNRWCAAIAGA